MKLNKKGTVLLHHFEGLKLKAYKCPADVWTIGYGNTFYEGGSKVKQGDTVTKERAIELFNSVATSFAIQITGSIKASLNENQFSSLVSFAYNVGVANFNKSTLLKKINIDKNDPTIFAEFLRWDKAAGKVLAGLKLRRQAEAKLYFEK
jgi:lysozyme